MKTQEEIVRETVEWYYTHPRATNSNGGCMYDDGRGNRCAVGRVIEDKWDLQSNAFFSYVSDMIYGVMRLFPEKVKSLDDILKEEYRGHSLEFWDNLQRFHDASENWIPQDNGGNVLHDSGKQYAKTYFKVRFA